MCVCVVHVTIYLCGCTYMYMYMQSCQHVCTYVHVLYTIYFLSGSTHPLLKEITQEVLLVRRRDIPPLPHLNVDQDHVTNTELGMIEFLFDVHIFINTCTYYYDNIVSEKQKSPTRKRSRSRSPHGRHRSKSPHNR